ncbi:MAG: DNA-binding protein WhiA [Culicoidibacterales bacterium]
MQTFSIMVKNELAHIELDKRENEAELIALLKFNGQLRLVNGKYGLDFQTENITTSRRAYQLLQLETDARLDVVVRKQMRLKKNNVYIIRMETGGLSLVDQYDILDVNTMCDKFVHTKYQIRAFLRGAFLSTGSLNDPHKSRNYHLEITSLEEAVIDKIVFFSKKYNFAGKKVKRKHQYVFYLKEAEKIGDFLAFIGAIQTLFDFEDIRIRRDMNNSINRITNCEIANTQKSLNTITKQLREIAIIENEIGLAVLGEKTEQIARLRREYDDASMVEFVEILNTYGIKLSKSGLNHQLRKISNLAQNIEKMNENI